MPNPDGTYELDEVEAVADAIWRSGHNLEVDEGQKVGKVSLRGFFRVVRFKRNRDDEDSVDLVTFPEDPDGNTAELTYLDGDEHRTVRGRVGDLIMESRDLIVENPITSAVVATIPVAVGSLVTFGIVRHRK